MTVFTAALDCGTAGERAAYLDRACAGTPGSRAGRGAPPCPPPRRQLSGRDAAGSDGHVRAGPRARRPVDRAGPTARKSADCSGPGSSSSTCWHCCYVALLKALTLSTPAWQQPDPARPGEPLDFLPGLRRVPGRGGCPVAHAGNESPVVTLSGRRSTSSPWSAFTVGSGSRCWPTTPGPPRPLHHRRLLRRSDPLQLLGHHPVLRGTHPEYPATKFGGGGGHYVGPLFWRLWPPPWPTQPCGTTMSCRCSSRRPPTSPSRRPSPYLRPPARPHSSGGRSRPSGGPNRSASTPSSGNSARAGWAKCGWPNTGCSSGRAR